MHNAPELSESPPASVDAANVELAIILPTYNERDNIEPMLAALARVLQGVCYEVIIVDDDSPDHTWALAQELARRHSEVRCLHRIDRRGLASACVDGMLASGAPWVVVMDADLQHDEHLLLAMLKHARADQHDLIVGSRFAEGGSTGSWDERRLLLSRLATRLTQMMLPVQLTDPMSGFFMIRKNLFLDLARRMETDGFKILFDLLISARSDIRVIELPFEFRQRHAGESKLDSHVVWHLGLSVVSRLMLGLVPRRFLSFMAVGGMGTLVHMSVLAGGYGPAGLSFDQAQGVAIFIAMTFNFFLNNRLTFRDRRLIGGQLWSGLLVFYAACSLGAFVNLGVAHYAFVNGLHWAPAGLAGAVAGAVWNFAITSVFAWRRR